MPGWLSATVVAAVTGVLLLAVFKYTSNQRAIKRVRDDINANLLALKLFKDSARVALQAQGRILRGACRLFVLAIVPMLVMAVPVSLLLGQLASLVPGPAAAGRRGGRHHAQARRRRRVVLARREPPAHRRRRGDRRAGPRAEQARGLLERQGPRRRQPPPGVPGRRPGRTKELAIGDGFMRVSQERPGWDWSVDSAATPGSSRSAADDPVRSIEIAYPDRSSWTSGTD